MTTEKLPEGAVALVKEISEKSGTTEKEVRKLIEEKQDELSGLVSAEGAAYMVGRELGVNLIRSAVRQFKIKNVIVGMRSVDIVSKVMQIWDIREFTRKDSKGRVMNVVLGDETGTIRFSLWDEQIDAFNSMNIKEGDVLEISRAWTKADNRENPELRLGKSSAIRKSDAKIEAVSKAAHSSDTPSGKRSYERKDISDLKDGMAGEVRACMVQLYSKNPLYNVCPQCGGRVEESDGKFRCEEHGEVQPRKQIVISGIIDDGTGSIRAVFFREQAEKVAGRNAEDMKLMLEKHKSEELAEALGCLGREFLVRGNVRVNKLTENLEIVANEVADVDVKAECDRLIKEFSVKKKK